MMPSKDISSYYEDFIGILNSVCSTLTKCQIMLKSMFSCCTAIASHRGCVQRYRVLLSRMCGLRDGPCGGGHRWFHWISPHPSLSYFSWPVFVWFLIYFFGAKVSAMKIYFLFFMSEIKAGIKTHTIRMIFLSQLTCLCIICLSS